MKTLCLFRHAKSTWGALGTDDIERPLHEIGEINAGLMGKFLAKKHLTPDLVMCSNALRAMNTAKRVIKGLNYPEEHLQIEPTIYDATVEDLLSILQQMDKKLDTILLIGHNPGLTMLSNYFSDQHVSNLPTCGVYCAQFDTDDWQNIATADSTTLFIDEPKNHQNNQ